MRTTLARSKAVRAWSGQGGHITVRQGGVTAGDAVLSVTPGAPLRVDSDGRLEGSLTTSLRQATRVVGALGSSHIIPEETVAVAQAVVAARQQGEESRLTLDFQAGRTTLGPVAIGPAPKVY